MAQRAAMYCRVSTKRQAESAISIPDQLDQCRAWCEQEGYEIAGEFIEPGASARSDQRKAFQDVIGQACSPLKPFDVIVVHSLSRFARNETDFHLYKHQLEKHGTRICSVTQNLSNDPNGDFMASVLSAVDAHQSAENAKHTKRTMLANAREGFWNGSMPPFGFVTYVAETRGKKEKKKLKVHDREAEIVKLIFDLYVEGTGASGPMGIKKIVTHLNTKGYRTRQGKNFSVQFVGKLLRTTAYIGKHYFNRRNDKTKTIRPRDEWIELSVPKIIEESIFFAAQERLDQNHPLKTPPRETNSPVLLTGIAHCGSCGSRMKLQTGKGGRYRYYKCANKADHGKDACKGKNVPERYLDDLVMDSFKTKVLSPKRLEGMLGTLASRISKSQDQLAKEIKGLKVERRRIEDAVKKLYHLVEEGVALDSTLSNRISELQQKREECVLLTARKQRQLDTPLKAFKDAQVDVFRKALISRLADEAAPEFRKAYVREFIARVDVSASEIRIQGPKAALLSHSAQVNETKGGLGVPTFAQEWRTGEDSNSRPLDS